MSVSDTNEALAEQIAGLRHDAAELRASVDATQVRYPSKAHLIGSLGNSAQPDDAHFFATVARANSPKLAGGYAEAVEAKAQLDEMGSHWADVPAESKATVGDTDGNGGYLIPGNIVAHIVEQATPRRGVVDLFTQITGVAGGGVDVPWESDAPTRAVIALPGATKENSDFSVNAYSATLYTLARIFDLGNQLIRHSAGAAEQLVRSKLARAFVLGEDYYALNGSGTNEPYGLLTALGSSGDYVTTFSTPADNTLAGSVAAAVATAAGDLEDRGAEATGIAMNTKDYWRMRRQGTDTAGFFVDPAAPANRDLSLFGVPLRHSPSVPTDTIVVGEFASVQLFRGLAYRVDTSSEAGDRWDKNLTGFRGEEEIALDARSAVFAGRFQRIVNAVGA